MGSSFGSMNPQATTDSGAPDPNQGLTGGQLFTRKALAGSLAGVGNAMQQQGGMRPQPVNFAALGGNAQRAVGNPQPVTPPQNQGAAPQQPQNAPAPDMIPGSPGPSGINGNQNPFPRGPRPSLFYGAPGGYS